ncbi:MAG: YbaN family protein [Candidatus Thiodiazotropha sp. LLP2]
MSKLEPSLKQSVTGHPLSKPWLLALGWLLFGLGVIGIALPLLPTTIFWIGAVWCWSRSAPHLTRRILAHPRFGQPVYLFITYGQMTRTGKWMAVVGMTIGFALFQIFGNPGWQASLGVSLVLVLVALWLWQRPEPICSSHEQDVL